MSRPHCFFLQQDLLAICNVISATSSSSMFASSLIRFSLTFCDHNLRVSVVRSIALHVSVSAMVPCRSDLLASTFWHSVLDRPSVSTTRIVELVVDCVVELSATAATIMWLSSCAGLPAASAVSLLEFYTMPLLKLCGVFLVRLSNLLCLSVQLHCSRCFVTVFANPADLLQRACNT